MLDLTKKDNFSEEKRFAIGGALLQAILALLIGHLFLRRDFFPTDIFALGGPVVASLIYTRMVKVPFWRTGLYGDGFDIALLIWLTACFSVGYTYHQDNGKVGRDVKSAVVTAMNNPDKLVKMTYSTTSGREVVVIVVDADNVND